MDHDVSDFEMNGSTFSHVMLSRQIGKDYVRHAFPLYQLDTEMSPENLKDFNSMFNFDFQDENDDECGEDS